METGALATSAKWRTLICRTHWTRSVPPLVEVIGNPVQVGAATFGYARSLCIDVRVEGGWPRIDTATRFMQPVALHTGLKPPKP